MKNIFFLISLALVLCVAFAKSNYSYDGSGNNIKNPTWGKARERLIRKVPIVYEDGISEPVGGMDQNTLPSTRHISNLLFGRQTESNRKVNKRLVTDILTYWGQFLDHDLDHSPDSPPSACLNFPIKVPTGDPYHDVNGEGGKIMRFCRTTPAPGPQTKEDPRQHPNIVTAFIDGSIVYGDSKDRADKLRTFTGGLLKTSKVKIGDREEELMVTNSDGKGGVLIGMANVAQRVPAGALFACGDRRCNENPNLIALHTLFVREHNRRCRALPDSMSDEQKYQEARRWVIGHIQAITVKEYFPALTGEEFPAYKKYDPNVNPQISSFFSTVAFRYGHDEVNSVLTRLQKDGRPISEGPILLRDSYFFPVSVSTVGIGCYLRGMSVNPQHDVDGMLSDDLRNFLFSQTTANSRLATDLSARNLQRGRDHGIARYNDCRKAYGLTPIATWSDLTADADVIDRLNKAYGKDNVNILDPYLGALLEKKGPNTNLGELFTVSIKEQLVRTRDGDRFWFENEGVFKSNEKKELENTKLSEIIVRNTDTEHLPKSIFFRKDVAPAVALGATRRSMTGWIIAIVVPTIVAIVLIVVVIVLLAKDKKVDNNNGDNQLYTNLLEEDK